MIKKVISGISIIFAIASCQKTDQCNYIVDYYQTVYVAEEAYYEGNYQKVFDEMNKATENCELLNQRGIYEMLIFAESSARIGEQKKAMELIRELILNGYEIDQLSNNESFQTLIGTAEWVNMEREYEALHNEYLNSINLPIRERISTMKYNDQYHRTVLSEQGINQDSIWEIINETDSINEIELKKIVETYGYPDERIIGGFKIDHQPIDPGILLFHFDDYKYWTTTLEELIKKGQAPPQSLGNFVDSYQRRIQDQKKFIYGIYDNAGEDRIVDYENLDERRVSIGLPPMKLKKSIDSLKRAFYSY